MFTPISVSSRPVNHGEAAIWLPQRNEIAWMDLIEGTLHRFHPETGRQIDTKVAARVPLGAIARTSNIDELLLCCRDGLGLLSIDTGVFRRLISIEDGRDGMCLNDMKVDRLGRIWVGSYEENETAGIGGLWCVSAIGTEFAKTLCDCGFVVPNGPAISKDGATLYFSDSLASTIYAYDIDQNEGKLSNKRIFVNFKDGDGVPDGITIDAEDCLWTAHWGGARVTRWSPSGNCLRTIELPAPNVTSVSFGGDEMRTLFVSTSRLELSEEDLENYPLAGSLFAIDTDCEGIEEPIAQIANRD